MQKGRCHCAFPVTEPRVYGNGDLLSRHKKYLTDWDISIWGYLHYGDDKSNRPQLPTALPTRSPNMTGFTAAD